MAKKALISLHEQRGNVDTGLRVLEVVESAHVFPVHTGFEWKDCPDIVESFKYWYESTSNTFKKLPDYVSAVDTAGELALGADGKPTEKYVWDWNNETWHKESL